MAAHTPGPWKAPEFFLSHGFTENDGSVPVLFGGGEAEVGRICTVSLRRTDLKRGKTYKAEDPERDANLRLILAAPAMLSALKAIDRAAGKVDPDSPLGAAIVEARQARLLAEKI